MQSKFAKGVTFKGNNIDLEDTISEKELVDEMKVINDPLKFDIFIILQ